MGMHQKQRNYDQVQKILGISQSRFQPRAEHALHLVGPTKCSVELLKSIETIAGNCYRTFESAIKKQRAADNARYNKVILLQYNTRHIFSKWLKPT